MFNAIELAHWMRLCTCVSINNRNYSQLAYEFTIVGQPIKLGCSSHFDAVRSLIEDKLMVQFPANKYQFHRITIYIFILAFIFEVESKQTKNLLLMIPRGKAYQKCVHGFRRMIRFENTKFVHNCLLQIFYEPNGAIFNGKNMLKILKWY